MRYEIWWTSEDLQAQMPGGEYASKAAAEAAINSVIDEFESQCGDQKQLEELHQGFFEILEKDND